MYSPGECLPSGSALAAAVRAACGRRLRRVPIRPEHITGT
jgi:CO/xanthine dehydrogenase Mo-binding subunit